MGENMVTLGKQLFAGSGGAWATRQMKKAFMEGRAMSAEALRTLDTLRHEDWKHFDDALVEEAVIRLVGVGDLISAGFVRPVANALGKTVFGYERVSNFGDASVSLDGLSRTGQDVQEFDLNQLPLPITHKDWFLNLRTLAASRDSGEPLDTMAARQAGRVVAEKLEYMLFQGGPTFGALKIYGYTTHPDRNQSTFNGGKTWEDSTKLGSSFLTDVQTMKNGLIADRKYGPYTIYVPTAADVVLDNDYNAATANVQTIRQRLMMINGITAIRVADQCPTGHVIMKQDSIDTAAWVQGEPLQTVQWDEYGGFELNFKAFAIGVPLIRSDIAGRSGIYDLHS